MYLLVKCGYVDMNDFMCPGRRSPKGRYYDPQNYNDFPDKSLVMYSIRISCPKTASAESGRRVIIADRSPVFEGIFLPLSENALPVTLSDKLLKLNSVNHKGRGQNVLFCDGSVTFVKIRFTDASLDDIYTLQNTKTYHGTELPASEADTFLAP
jgi:prepilin-type processing-associated H-X9-DG protein